MKKLVKVTPRSRGSFPIRSPTTRILTFGPPCHNYACVCVCVYVCVCVLLSFRKESACCRQLVREHIRENVCVVGVRLSDRYQARVRHRHRHRYWHRHRYGNSHRHMHRHTHRHTHTHLDKHTIINPLGVNINLLYVARDCPCS